MSDIEKIVSSVVAENAVLRGQEASNAQSAASDNGAPTDRFEAWAATSQLPNIRKRLVKQTTLIFDTEAIEPLDRKVIDYDDGRISSVRVAMIKTDLKLDIQELYSGETPQFYWHEKEPKGLLTPAEDVRDKVVESRAKQLAEAMRLGADIVSFCEFALPPADLSVEPKCAPPVDVFDETLIECVDGYYVKSAVDVLNTARRLCDREIRSLGGEVEAEADEAVPFIVYGSSHCGVTRFNVGVVSPGSPLEKGYKVRLERTNPLAVISRDNGIAHSGKQISEVGRSGPIVHRKRFPARRAGERARVPDDHTFRTYFHPLGRICVLICSDAIDINQFLNIIRFNEEAGPLSLNRIFMVIVPTFNQSTFLLDACKDLSALARTNVLVTNAAGTLQVPGDPPYTEKLIASEFFFDGRPLDHLISKRVATAVPTNDPTVEMFDLNIKFQRDVIRQNLPG